MSCPTCGHTMQSLGGSFKLRHWCPRCGTLKSITPTGGGMHEEVEAPKLMERCRLFEDRCLLEGTATLAAVSLWVRLGVNDSIHPPEERFAEGWGKQPPTPEDRP